ncbi:VOC family protein [Williamsia sp.]|uniref:VOC family protein n=1 Tax=Williamsia sp. TaxID=1872085 RepID=UPI001A359D8C|nr:VOC family protein [Williamsia sp.]MBJ7287299.1 glyoxalase [Williamsia sp.]
MTVTRVMPVVTVTDLAAAVAEHRAVLGLEVVMDRGWIATLANSDHSCQVSVMTKDQTAPCNPAVSIEVSDVDARYQAALDASLEIVHPLSDEEWGVRRFFYRDSAGTVVNVLTHH